MKFPAQGRKVSVQAWPIRHLFGAEEIYPGKGGIAPSQGFRRQDRWQPATSPAEIFHNAAVYVDTILEGKQTDRPAVEPADEIRAGDQFQKPPPFSTWLCHLSCSPAPTR